MLGTTELLLIGGLALLVFEGKKSPRDDARIGTWRQGV